MLLHHGTTRARAEAIRDKGPDANFREPHGEPAGEFSTAPSDGPFDLGLPEDCARRKARLFPEEGGPALLVLELSEEQANQLVGTVGQDEEGKACHWGSEIWFGPSFGLEELVKFWPQISKQVNILKEP